MGGVKDRWTLLVVYRGKHCGRCKPYLNKLQGMKAAWEDAGFDIVTVSADPIEKARGRCRGIRLVLSCRVRIN